MNIHFPRFRSNGHQANYSVRPLWTDVLQAPTCRVCGAHDNPLSMGPSVAGPGGPGGPGGPVGGEELSQCHPSYKKSCPSNQGEGWLN